MAPGSRTPASPAIALAPWGLPAGAWDADGLKAITTPILFVAGSADDVSGYEKGTRALDLATTRADRYLLTFLNGSHNVGAPIPAPRPRPTPIRRR